MKKVLDLERGVGVGQGIRTASYCVDATLAFTELLPFGHCGPCLTFQGRRRAVASVHAPNTGDRVLGARSFILTADA